MITGTLGTGEQKKIATLDASYRGLVPHVPCVSVVCVC